MFLVVTLAYIIFWGPLFIVSSSLQSLIQTNRLLLKEWFWQQNRRKHHWKQIKIEVNPNELKMRRNKSKWKGNPCALGLDFWGRKAINGSWGDYGDSGATDDKWQCLKGNDNEGNADDGDNSCSWWMQWSLQYYWRLHHIQQAKNGQILDSVLNPGFCLISQPQQIFRIASNAI